MKQIDPLVSVGWLAENISRPDVKVLDGTWVMPSSGEACDFSSDYIQGAQHFDIDEIADKASPFSHMLPGADIFERAVSNMGISNDDIVVVYDRHGLRTAPRVWWMFKMFGHVNVFVLCGGLPEWFSAGHDLHPPAKDITKTDYRAKAPILGVISKDEIIERLPAAPQILDARSAGRFNGTAPEPRAGLRSGHIPNSRSLPYTDLIRHTKNMIHLEDVAARVEQTGIDLSAPIITSCGSGVTACVLALALYRLGARDISVYDGSWTEWGGSDAPIALPQS
ncbi:MAG: rhodanese-like domain-containing protein [Maricaulaceae bacterium]